MKILSALYILLLFFFLPFSAHASSFSNMFSTVGTLNTVPADTDDIIYMIESLYDTEKSIYCKAYYNEDLNQIHIDIAFDGFITEVVCFCKKGIDPNCKEWLAIREAFVDFYDSISLMLHILGRNDLNLSISIVNDDAYIHQDYSTISYNPILSIRNGTIYIDIVKDMSLHK